MKLLYTAIALAIAPLAPAHALPSAAPAEARADAEALVAQLVGDDAMVKLGRRAFDSGVDGRVAGDARIQQTYAANPGLKQHVADELRGEFIKIMLHELPGLRRQLSVIVGAEMTGAEIADTLAFFRSSVGQKLKAQAYASIGDKPGQTPEQMQQAAMAAVMSNLAPEDYPPLLAFGATSAAQKMQTLNPKISATSQAWANRLVAENEARMRALALKATSDFLAKKKP
jgi:hypothetical protein